MFELPANVRAYLHGIFAGANHSSSSYLTAVPNAHEPHLDTALVSSIARHARPVQFDNDWVVKLDTHFLGNSRYWGRWEIADIGLLLMFRRRGDLLRTKVALLQSKRLYPNEQKSEDEPNYVGFGALRESEKAFLNSVAPRTFRFNSESRYRALQVDDGQYVAIDDYESLSQIPIYYLFYNPAEIPLDVELPCIDPDAAIENVSVGCRVMPYQFFRNDVVPNLTTLSPTYGEVCLADTPPFDDPAHEGGWRLEEFVVNRFIKCECGYQVDADKDSTLANLFGGRSAPIFAAISINIDVPDNATAVE